MIGPCPLGRGPTRIVSANKAAATHAAQHAAGGSDPITPESIGAAPGGFGLGSKGKLLTPEDNLDEVKTNGWYYWERGREPKGTLPVSIGQNDYASRIRVWGNGAVCYQECVDMTQGNAQGCLCSRTIYGSKIYPWEWVNPPMILGAEYRTTERYLGEPVHVKVVDCGVLPNGATLTVKHEIANVGMIVEAKAIASNSTAGYNGRAPFPQIYNNSLTNGWTNYLVAATSEEILIYCGGGLAGCSVYVTMRYTKTTQ